MSKKDQHDNIDQEFEFEPGLESEFDPESIEKEFSEQDHFDPELEAQNEEADDFFNDADQNHDNNEYINEDEEKSSKRKFSLTNAKGLVGFVKSNWLFVGLGTIGVVVAIYIVAGIFSSSTPHRAVNNGQSRGFGMGPVVSQPAQQASSGPVNNITMSQSNMDQLMQGFAQQVREHDAQVNSRISKVQQSQEALAKAMVIEQTGMTTLGSRMDQLQNQLGTVSKDLQENSQEISAVTKQLKMTRGELTMLAAQTAAGIQKLKLRAVVPGRAWLVNNAGQTISVTQGDSLPYYGTVTRIDSVEDKVYMSSGYIFE